MIEKEKTDKTGNSRLRVMMLGDRRIAAAVMQKFLISEWTQHFEVAALVTNDVFFGRCVEKGLGGATLLRNDQRNTEEILSAIKTLNIDFILSVQHNWILPAEVLDAVGGRAFNLHNAKLPDYKGYNSIGHVILNNEKKHFSTLHWMDVEVDAGDIAYEDFIELKQDDTALSLYLRTIPKSVEIVFRLLTDIKEGRNPPRTPIGKGGRFFGRDDLEEVRDVSDVSDQSMRDRVIRAVYFPPLEPAYIVRGGTKEYQIPMGYAHIDWRNSAAANEPHWG